MLCVCMFETMESNCPSVYCLCLFAVARCLTTNQMSKLTGLRIVVGLRNSALSEKLRMEATLTLEKATAEARQSEAVKKQQSLLHSDFQESSRKSVEYVEKVKPSKGQGGARRKPNHTDLQHSTSKQSPKPSRCTIDAVELLPTLGRGALLEARNAISVVKRDIFKQCARLVGMWVKCRRKLRKPFWERCRTPRTPTHGP